MAVKEQAEEQVVTCGLSDDAKACKKAVSEEALQKLFSQAEALLSNLSKMKNTPEMQKSIEQVRGILASARGNGDEESVRQLTNAMSRFSIHSHEK